ncbi:hypothetical protein VPH35_078006 [Triticum aestivum]
MVVVLSSATRLTRGLEWCRRGMIETLRHYNMDAPFDDDRASFRLWTCSLPPPDRSKLHQQGATWTTRSYHMDAPLEEDRAFFPWWSCICASFVHITFFRHTAIFFPSSHEEYNAS